MRNSAIVLSSIVLLTLGAASAAAHHSAVMFDFSQSVEVEGVVKGFRVANPHTRLFLEVTDERGTREIEYEGHSRNNFYRAGWRPEKGRVGEKMTVFIAPRRDGKDGGYITAFVTADGEKIGF